VDRVLQANPGLASLQAAAEAARYRIEPAGSLDDPMLSYATAPRTAGSGRLNQRVELSQPFPWPGTLGAREQVARHEAAAAEGDLEALQLRVITRTRAAHAEWRFVHEALDIYHATLALLDELIATTETRYAAGRASRQDVLQAEVERTDLNNEEFRLLRRQTAVRAGINALLDRSPDEPLPVAAPIAALPEPPALEALQSLALAQHPELSRFKSRLSANRSRVTLAEKAFYPDFQVGVGYNSLWNDPDQRPIVGVTINVPLDRGKRRAELYGARAEVTQAQWALAERRAEILADLARARAEVVEARQSVMLYQDELVPLSAEYLDAAIADYQSGTGAFLNVITAEQRKLTTELALARTRADFARRLADLEGWAGLPLNRPQPTSEGAQQ
jgi:outer membrane protein TolC